MSRYSKVFLYPSPRPRYFQHSIQKTAVAVVSVTDKTNWSPERCLSLYTPLIFWFGHMNASNQSFLGNKEQCSSAEAPIFRIFHLTVFFQICLRRSRQAYLPQTLPLSPWGVFTQMAGVLYFRKHSSRKTFVQAGSPQRTYFLSPCFVGIKSLAPDPGATHQLTLCACEATQSQGTGRGHLCCQLHVWGHLALLGWGRRVRLWIPCLIIQMWLRYAHKKQLHTAVAACVI